MALCKQAVEKAWYLFRDMLGAEGMCINSFISEFDKSWDEDAVRTGHVFGVDRKYDDGWENVFIQLREFTPQQKEIWEKGIDTVPYSSFVHEPNQHGVWQIGFF
ncbi:hypothetical protein [Chitinophaga tropicalis]|uniref:Uncharacterized protein n=1 Tax=Chitinophaga tropicalis TaxID=2683588 RepID=A0A7K1UAG7_9BACT|nr:hypothetical protein [Chitinophaga tropicalis]MVT11362.1 hypothetical protein [Chitinophaga tropicalis]